LNEVVRRNRERHFEKAIARDSVKQMLASLNAGHAVWYAPDQNFRNKGAVTVPFFGHPASTNSATSRLARITGARVIPYAVRRKPGTAGYEIELGEPLSEFPTDDLVADTARVNRVLEAMIRRAPEQYLWVHRRFKLRTGKRPDLPDPYDR
jgi:KDO2-lipid IV(A) lauroyltransferase